jgi:hypothetical protein
MASNRPNSWEPVTLPEGLQPVPAWAKDMAVNWMDGYGNAPTLAIKVPTYDVHSWDGQVWYRTERGLYYTQHEDGRACFHTHAGRVSRNDDGVLQTTQQEGYAGRHFTIQMADDSDLPGEKLILRGPWHAGGLPGYMGVTTVEQKLATDRFWLRHKRPWHQRGGCFGLTLNEDAILRIFARYQPHLRMARVSYSWWPHGSFLEPLKPEWNAPKDWMWERNTVKVVAA